MLEPVDDADDNRKYSIPCTDEEAKCRFGDSGIDLNRCFVTAPASEPVLRVSSSSIYFGGVELGQSYKKRILLLPHPSCTKMVELLIKVAGPFLIVDENQSLVKQRVLQFDPHQDTSIVLDFQPTELGSVSSKLKIYTLDPVSKEQEKICTDFLSGYGEYEGSSLLSHHFNCFLTLFHVSIRSRPSAASVSTAVSEIVFPLTRVGSTSFQDIRLQNRTNEDQEVPTAANIYYILKRVILLLAFYFKIRLKEIIGPFAWLHSQSVIPSSFPCIRFPVMFQPDRSGLHGGSVLLGVGQEEETISIVLKGKAL